MSWQNKSQSLSQVSWIRYSDTHLLTLGRLTYTSDLRFKAIHKMFSEDYLLQIKPVTHRDAGKYQCQISTTPPTSHIVNLAVAGMFTLGFVQLNRVRKYGHLSVIAGDHR